MATALADFGLRASATPRTPAARGCEFAQVIGDLTREQVHAVAAAHNTEREGALAILDGHTGT